MMRKQLARIMGTLCTAFLVVLGLPNAGAQSEFTVKRLNNNQPVVSIDSFNAVGVGGDGHSINGPSVIRVPAWVTEKADPSAKYYLYFGDHGGQYIRMAWAANIGGPYTLFNLGSNNTAHPGRGVLDANSSQINFTTGKHINKNHISSPDVVVDDTNRRIILYFHVGDTSDESVTGDKWFDTGAQVTFAATSKTGLNFNGGSYVTSGGVSPGETGTDLSGEGFGIKPYALGNAYFRTFRYSGRDYAFTNYGPIWAGPTTGAPWSTKWTHVKWANGTLTGGGNPVWDDLMANYKAVGAVAPRYYAGYDGTGSSPYGQNAPRTGAPRHFATRLLSDGKTLEVYYTCRGEKPEGVYRTQMDLSQGDYTTWDTVTLPAGHPQANYVHQPVIFPEYAWEGSEHALTISKNGAETDVNAIRDPYIFTDSDGKSYLFYSGNPESTIGVAAINNLPTAAFSINKDAITEGESISVDASGSADTDGAVADYSWDWGDGSSSTGVNATHTYTTYGTYVVTLTCTDNVGGISAGVTTTVLVDALPVDVPFPNGNGTGTATREIWTGITGTKISDLTSNANYPDNPDVSSTVTSLDIPKYGNNYGQRIRGYIHAPVTTTYTFSFCTDDYGQFFLSTNGDPANAVQMAYINGWAPSGNFTKYASQTSAPVNLVAGQKYYFEILMKEGKGGDHVQLGWKADSYVFELIPGDCLSPYVVQTNTPPVAQNDAYQVDQDGSIAIAAPGILANDTDADGDAITAVLAVDAANGTLTLLDDGSFTYIPDAGFSGTDSFSYQATDGSDSSALATVTITVSGTSQPAQLEIASVTASNAQDGNPPANAFDGDLNTRWSSSTFGVTLDMELATASTVQGLNIAVFYGDARKNIFDISVSDDGTTWTKVGSYMSSGTTTQLEYIELPDTSAKHVRLTGYGNTVSGWNSYTEIQVLGTPNVNQTVQLGIANVTASNAQDGNPPANAFDGDLNTRWSSKTNGVTLDMELTAQCTIQGIKVAAYNGDSRQNIFDISVSDDGTTWTKVGSYRTSGTTKELEYIALPETSAKYVRLTGYGATTSSWNSYTEIEIHGYEN